MSNFYDKVVFYDELSPSQQEAFQDELEHDPERAELFARWQAVRSALRRRLDAAVPDRSLLVLYALDRKGHRAALTADEREALEAARSDLEQALETYPGLAEVVAGVEEDSEAFEEVWDQQTGTDPTGPSLAKNHPPVRRRSRVRRWVWRLSVTAAILLFAVLLTLILDRDRSMISITTLEGERQLVELADGSTVRLMGHSELTYPDPEEETAFDRRVHIDGRAFFEVASGSRGFAVETPTAVATALGTSFGVEADSDETELVLATGRLTLAPKEAPDRMVVLEPGQKSRVAQNALPTTPVAVDLNEELDWTGLFIFQRTPLQTIAEHLSDHYDVSVTVTSDLEEEQVTGTFDRGQPLSQILSVLTATLGTDYHAVSTARYVIGPDD